MKRRMRRATRHRLLTLTSAVGLALAAAAALTMTSVAEPQPGLPVGANVGGGGSQAQAASTDQAPERAPHDVPVDAADPRMSLGLDPDKFELEDGHYVQHLEDGRTVVLTLEPETQREVEKHIDLRKPPQAGLAAVEPSTGRVLALVSRSYDDNRRIDNYALRAEAPSASVFKLVTAAALIDLAHVDPTRPVCYSGGRSHLTEDEIKGNPATDRTCANLGDAVARSLNVVIARLAYYNLTRENLEEMALRFGFNREIPFELPVAISEATFVEDDIERARTAAGFWNVNLSSLHGALLAAAIANDGVMMRPTIVDRVLDAEGNVLFESTPEPWLSVMSPANARTLLALSEGTTTAGTATRVFKSDHFPSHVRVGGKTGTLSNKRPYRLFTWFVGAAPVDAPNIAVGSVVANPQKWWIKGTHTSATAIKTYESLIERQARVDAPEANGEEAGTRR